MDIVVLLLFVCMIVMCVISDISIVLALIAGYMLFSLYAFKKGFSVKNVLIMSLQGLKAVSTILITFLLIGILTALWRASGTIATIVCFSTTLIRPQIFFLASFLLCCLVSFLTGTAFGTSATMGAICVTIGHALQLNPVIIGGAVLSGAYFGDRCSPVSTSALLVAAVTKTDLHDNNRNMLKSAVVPFLLSCAVYLLLGAFLPAQGGNIPDIHQMFEQEFSIGFVAVIPAILILVCAFAKANVKHSMLISILAAAAVCLLYQRQSVNQLLHFALLGFSAKDPTLSTTMNGGGVLSMIHVTAIVCISSMYAGIFRETGLLTPITHLIGILSKRLSTYAVVLPVALITGAFACNQTLSIMLTEQLCAHLEQNKTRFALYLENSAVVVPPLLPWTVACSVSLTSAGAPMHSFPFAFFLILLPLWSLWTFHKIKKEHSTCT